MDTKSTKYTPVIGVKKVTSDGLNRYQDDGIMQILPLLVFGHMIPIMLRLIFKIEGFDKADT